MKVRFDFAQFQFSHGKAPKGFGVWAFAFDRSCDHPFFAPRMSFADAKKFAKQFAVSQRQDVVWVCP